MTDVSDLFLNDHELRELTGRAIRRLQIAALRDMLIPFRVNAIGRLLKGYRHDYECDDEEEAA